MSQSASASAAYSRQSLLLGVFQVLILKALLSVSFWVLFFLFSFGPSSLRGFRCSRVSLGCSGYCFRCLRCCLGFRLGISSYCLNAFGSDASKVLLNGFVHRTSNILRGRQQVAPNKQNESSKEKKSPHPQPKFVPVVSDYLGLAGRNRLRGRMNQGIPQSM